MKISNKLPHFNEPTLLVVSSPRGAVFYVALKDEITQVADFKIDRPKYSDAEDFEAGAQIDREKSTLDKDFKQKFSATILHISKKFSVRKLYLFTAKNISSLLERLLPKNWKNLIAGHLRGDYTKFHPFQILEKIKNLDVPGTNVQVGIA